MENMEPTGLYKELATLAEEKRVSDVFDAIERLLRDLTKMHDRYCAHRLDDEVAGYIRVSHLRNAKALYEKIKTDKGN